MYEVHIHMYECVVPVLQVHVQLAVSSHYSYKLVPQLPISRRSHFYVSISVAHAFFKFPAARVGQFFRFLESFVVIFIPPT